VIVRLHSDKPLLEILEDVGLPPLPPYIKRPQAPAQDVTERDRLYYQTVYARVPGAVAAPTAGLHLTESLLAKLGSQGVSRATVTLHVGMGTFKPVKVDTVEDHAMEAERYEVPGTTVAAIEQCKRAGGRVVAVGSTTVRTLETAAAETGVLQPGCGRTRIFIYPPYSFKVVELMLTNFHLPRSTLIMMVSALAGGDLIRKAYAEAVRERYRFYSYGDCMLIV
jgi:S-adenosylmethionine:tRNA ribosyltransferase-isomerase